MKVYFRLKGAVFGSLGHVVTRGKRDNTTGELMVMDRYMSIFLNRMWHFKERYGYDWDNLFSHVVSHEHMHNAIFKSMGMDASGRYDMILGNAKASFDVKKVRTGINMNLEE